MEKTSAERGVGLVKGWGLISSNLKGHEEEKIGTEGKMVYLTSSSTKKIK